MAQPPDSLQVYSLWEFPQGRSESAYFGRMPEQVVVDPFAGGVTSVPVTPRETWSG